MCAENISRPGMREIARAVSLLLVETDKRRDKAIDEIVEQANNSFELIEQELQELKEKSEQIESLRLELNKIKALLARLASAMGEETHGTEQREARPENGANGN